MTEREFKAWRRWLLGEHEKCPLCGRPLPRGSQP
jgi:DNA repair exonuclease SbcCD ATPase subunit